MDGNGARLYDYLMEDEAPYHQWLAWTIAHLEEMKFSAPAIADVGCGTGTLMSMLLSRGYDVQGIDYSQEMLAVADEKIRAYNNVAPDLRAQHMSYLQLEKQVDAIIVFCDALNYLADEAEVKQAFRAFYDHLTPGGRLLFDVHSLSNMNHHFPGRTYGDAATDVSLILNSFSVDDVPGAVEHEMTFFERLSNGDYRRFDELHRQRTFSVADYEQWLQAAGFEQIEITADFTKQPPQADSERIFFSIRKT
ncbi:methyltransferase domain-containing protein [Salicibibacter cibarius]|uniref:Methyltransferase domain-containing protein n=1 Tax=Salicibibacter cibarius TaxID=2743000 RepID=A0A7T7CBF1_9BACI|nr:class I SAM-dependent methyltransferase [Salicibibacter cibarius]QQK75798.1 methyltransferase domain-containing protein [Salicibibacter cibarius]